MKHDLLEEVWRVRDEISAECGYDVKRLGAMLRRQESKYLSRLVRGEKRNKPTRPSTRPKNIKHRTKK